MSIEAISWAFKREIENSGAKFVLVALANHANDENCSWPSVKTIERITGIKPRTIAQHLNFLEEEGFIRRKPRFLPNGGQTSSLYEICMAPSSPLPLNQGGDDITAGPFLNLLDEPKENPLPSSPKAANVGPEVKEVFEFWKEALNHPRAVLDVTRVKKIKDRLKEGYSAEDLKQAVRGLTLSPHEMGQNDRNTVYDDISLICRDAPHVERYMARAEQIAESEKGQKEVYFHPPSGFRGSIEELKYRLRIGYFDSLPEEKRPTIPENESRYI